MKTFFSIFFGALGGLAFCYGFLKLAEALGLTAIFPAFAGEEDFGIRASMFVFGLLPAFLLFGGWVGFTLGRVPRKGGAMVFGAVAGSVIHFTLEWFLRHPIQALPNRQLANAAVGGSFLVWFMLVLVCALLAQAIFGSTKPAKEAKIL